MNWFTRRLSARASTEGAGEHLSGLLLAAREDDALRGQLLALLRLPGSQREPLIRTALHEMTLRREDPSLQAAFAALIGDDAAALALRVLEGG